MEDYKFFKMQELPEKSVDDKSFSKTVMVYDKTDSDHIFSNLGYYDFESSEWVHFGDESMQLICWCEIPSPEKFISTNDLEVMLHRGYRP